MATRSASRSYRAASASAPAASMPRRDPAEQVDLPGRVDADVDAGDVVAVEDAAAGTAETPTVGTCPARAWTSASRAWVRRAAATARSRLPALASSIRRVSRGSSKYSHHRPRSAASPVPTGLGQGRNRLPGSTARPLPARDNRGRPSCRRSLQAPRNREGRQISCSPPLLYVRCRASMFGRAVTCVKLS